MFRKPAEQGIRKTPIFPHLASPKLRVREPSVCGTATRGMKVMSVQGEKRVGLYLRVSTSEQTTDNQRRELEAVAARHGWTVVQVFEDAGISGASTRS
jgi:predicted site-specific integrase-resolvase